MLTFKDVIDIISIILDIINITLLLYQICNS